MNQNTIKPNFPFLLKGENDYKTCCTQSCKLNQMTSCRCLGLYTPYSVSCSFSITYFQCKSMKIYNLKTPRSCAPLCQQKYLIVTLPTKAGKQTQAFQKHILELKPKVFRLPLTYPENITTRTCL